MQRMALTVGMMVKDEDGKEATVTSIAPNGKSAVIEYGPDEARSIPASKLTGCPVYHPRFSLRMPPDLLGEWQKVAGFEGMSWEAHPFRLTRIREYVNTKGETVPEHWIASVNNGGLSEAGEVRDMFIPGGARMLDCAGAINLCRQLAAAFGAR